MKRIPFCCVSIRLNWPGIFAVVHRPTQAFQGVSSLFVQSITRPRRDEVWINWDADLWNFSWHHSLPCSVVFCTTPAVRINSLPHLNLGLRYAADFLKTKKWLNLQFLGSMFIRGCRQLEVDAFWPAYDLTCLWDKWSFVLFNARFPCLFPFLCHSHSCSSHCMWKALIVVLCLLHSCEVQLQ